MTNSALALKVLTGTSDASTDIPFGTTRTPSSSNKRQIPFNVISWKEDDKSELFEIDADNLTANFDNLVKILLCAKLNHLIGYDQADAANKFIHQLEFIFGVCPVYVPLRS